MATLSRRAQEPVIGPLGVVAPPPIAVECESFTGSLPMLLVAIKAKKVDLMDVPLGPICEAYLMYLLESATEVDLASAALPALAYLLERKAWQLLPAEEPEPEHEGETALILPSIDAYEPVIEALRLLEDERSRLFFRTPETCAQYELPFELGDVEASDLGRALESLLRRAVPGDAPILARSRRSLSDQMSIVRGALQQQPLPLDDLVVGEFTRAEAVWWFLALLELIRLGQARVRLEGESVLFQRGEA